MDALPSLLGRYVEGISAASKLQARALARWMSDTDARYREFAEDLCADVTNTLLGGDLDRGVRAYVGLCREINEEQFYFKKLGVYRAGSAQAAFATMYAQDARMADYIVGLLLSYVFWPNHYKLIAFFQDHLAGRPPRSVCDIGVGHGLLTREALRRSPDAHVTLVDVSSVSLKVAERMLATFGIAAARVHLVLADFLAEEDIRLPAADLLVLGEVLEHVDEPARFLARARALLAPDARIFLTTCANCPAPDHVYLFHDADEIRTLVRDAGFSVEHELVLASETSVPPAQWAAKRVNVNYGAILRGT